MSNSIFRAGRNFAVVTTLLALVGVATSVQAASFRKGWDPEFSDAFSSLVGVDVGWRGEALIFVDDGCVTSSSTVSFGSNSCGTANLQSYELEFYDVQTNALLGSGSDSLPGTPIFPAVTAIIFNAASIPDFVSLAGPLLVPGLFSFGNFSGFSAELTFGLTGPSVRLSDVECEGECIYDNDGQTYPPLITWSRVPAPATLALIGIGLAGLGWSRRKKV